MLSEEKTETDLEEWVQENVRHLCVTQALVLDNDSSVLLRLTVPGRSEPICSLVAHQRAVRCMVHVCVVAN